MPDTRNTPPLSVGRIFAALQHLAGAPAGATLSELAGAVAAPTTSVLDLLRGLADQGYVVREGRAYRLGPEAYLLAGRILAGRNIGQIVRPALEALSAVTGETSGLALLSNDRTEMIHIEFVSGSSPIRFEPTIGERHTLHNGAGGRLMLSLLPDEEVDRYLASAQLAKSTPDTVTSKSRLKDILAAARRDLFTATFGENVPGAAAFAAPVFNQAEQPAGALLLIGPVERMRAKQDLFLNLTCKAGMDASRLLGSSCRHGHFAGN